MIMIMIIVITYYYYYYYHIVFIILLLLPSGLGLSRCLGPGECLHSFIHSSFADDDDVHKS